MPQDPEHSVSEVRPTHPGHEASARALKGGGADCQPQPCPGLRRAQERVHCTASTSLPCPPTPKALLAPGSAHRQGGSRWCGVVWEGLFWVLGTWEGEWPTFSWGQILGPVTHPGRVETPDGAHPPVASPLLPPPYRSKEFPRNGAPPGCPTPSDLSSSSRETRELKPSCVTAERS